MGAAEDARDAARYRWIRSKACGFPEDFAAVEDASFSAHFGAPDNFDFNIDEMMAVHPEVKHD